MYLAARLTGVTRPVHALEALVEEAEAVTEDKTVCGRLAASVTDTGAAVVAGNGSRGPVELEAFEAVAVEERCATCEMVIHQRLAGMSEGVPRFEMGWGR